MTAEEAGGEASNRDPQAGADGSAVEDAAMHVEGTGGGETGLWSQFHGHVPGRFVPYSAAAGAFRGGKMENNFLKTCRWSPDGSCVFASTDDNQIRVFELPQGESPSPGVRVQCAKRVRKKRSKFTAIYSFAGRSYSATQTTLHAHIRSPQQLIFLDRRCGLRRGVGAGARSDEARAQRAGGRDHLRRGVAPHHVVVRSCELPLLFDITRQPCAHLGCLHRSLPGDHFPILPSMTDCPTDCAYVATSRATVLFAFPHVKWFHLGYCFAGELLYLTHCIH